MKARPHANSPQSWPQTTMATRRNQLYSLLEQMGVGPRLPKGAALSGDSGAEVQAVCLPFVCLLPAHCLLEGARNYSYSQ